VLADIEIKGVKRKVLMQAPKNGIFYVLDRTNGKLISAKPFTYINWAKGIDTITGRPMENVFSRYTNQNAEIFPGPVGAHSWHPMAFNLKTKLMYIPVRDLPQIYGQDINWKYNQPGGFGSGVGWNTAIGFDATKPLRKDSSAPQIQERLIAWDPVLQKEVWRVPHKALWNGGVLTTSGGLVFQGTADGRFMAFDAVNAKVLWEVNIGSGIIASPVTYIVEGVQYISIAAGWGGVLGLGGKSTSEIKPGTVYTFALDKNVAMPTYAKPAEQKLIDMPFTATKQELQHGGILFTQFCSTCHSNPGDGGGVIPDLGYAPQSIHNIFNEIVLKGLLVNKGMPNFGDHLNEKDVAEIHNYVLATAKEALAKQKKKEK
jgi:quinohemoprotein ethanol dehydrogenase